MWFSALEGLISSCRKSSVDEHKDRVSFSDVSLSEKIIVSFVSSLTHGLILLCQFWMLLCYLEDAFGVHILILCYP